MIKKGQSKRTPSTGLLAKQRTGTIRRTAKKRKKPKGLSARLWSVFFGMIPNPAKQLGMIMVGLGIILGGAYVYIAQANQREIEHIPGLFGRIQKIFQLVHSDSASYLTESHFFREGESALQKKMGDKQRPSNLRSVGSKLDREVPLKIIIKPGSRGAHPQSEVASLTESAKLAAQEHPSDILASISQKLQKNSDFARVHAMWSGRRTVVVSTLKRKPFLLMEAVGLRFVTDAGIVYGFTKDKSLGDSMGLPLVSGLIEPNTDRVLERLNDNSFSLSVSEKNIMVEIIELATVARDHYLKFSKIHFDKYRGFVVTLAENKANVSLGRSPFTLRIKRLVRMMKNLKEQGILYSRIELDYDGKAFIKEKPM